MNPPIKAQMVEHIIQIPLEALVPYARNARTHSPEQVAKIAGSIREFGFCNPVLVDDQDGIIAGHCRVLAAQKLGLTDVPCIRLSHLTDTQRRAYILADNQLTLLAGWDTEMLKLEIMELQSLDFNVELTGFDPDELAELNLGDESGDAADEVDPHLTMAERFGIAPFSVLNAREGWWQNRKRAWIATGIKSELGRGENLCNPQGAYDGLGGLINEGYKREAAKAAKGLTWGDSPAVTEKGLNHYRNKKKANATPGGGAMPAMDYSKKQRGDGRGRPIPGSEG